MPRGIIVAKPRSKGSQIQNGLQKKHRLRSKMSLMLQMDPCVVDDRRRIYFYLEFVARLWKLGNAFLR